MQLHLPHQSLREHNRDNHADLLTQLERAATENPSAEPKTGRALRQHLSGQSRLRHNFEAAWLVGPSAPVRFAEALFSLQDEQGQRIPSQTALRELLQWRPELRLESRFRFWLGFTAAEAFFEAGGNNTHLSMNIPAFAAASPYFSERCCHAVQLLKRAYPGKGIIFEMLEHQPWNDAQRATMARLQQLGVGWAVDDYGAVDGHHSPRSLQLATEYSSAVPPLVKLDGGLIQHSLKHDNFDVFAQRMTEVQSHCPQALVVLEWVQSAAELGRLRQALDARGISQPFSFVQSHGFNGTEQAMAQRAFSAPPRP